MAKKASKKSKKASKKKSSKKSGKKQSELPKRLSRFEYDLGKLSFVFGIVLSILVGFLMGANPRQEITVGMGITLSILFLLGLIVGLLNITTKEVNEFLLASITFLVAASVNVFVISITLATWGAILNQVFTALNIFVAPAATVVALKAMYDLAKQR